MDKLYVGDIPKDFHYAVISDNHIDLYNQNIAQNIDLPYYRVYFNSPGFYYSRGTTRFGAYNYTTFENIEVTDNICYRKDFPSIVVITLAFTIVGIWLTNLITSLVRKGGLLGGLF